MARVNDVGGMEGFGPVPLRPDDGDAPAFEADWQARVFALASALVHAGVYELDEFRDAIERMPVPQYLAASYYQRWLHAIETLCVDKGVLAAEDLEAAR